MRKIPLHIQILIALVLAVVAGITTGQSQARWALISLRAFELVGTLFLQALKMLVIPLVVSSLVSGVSGLGSGRALGRLGLGTVLFYTLTTFLAILVGLGMVNLIAPGVMDGQPVGERLGLEETPALLTAGEPARLTDFFLRLVPPNIVGAAAEGQMLGLIFFSLLFGYFLTRTDGQGVRTLADFFQGLFQVMMRVTKWVMRFAPIGVFGLVATVVASTGLAAIQPLALFVITVLSALLIHFIIVLPFILMLFGQVNPWKHYQAMAPALLTAFSTSSSSATVPVTMDCLEKKARISNQTSSFVVPLGATVNMDGTALYECVAALFIAQAYGLQMEVTLQMTVVLLALLTSIGVAGIPSASLVAIVIILGAMGLPAEGIGLILAVDRILDMCRTSVNVCGDSCGAVVIARLAGERPYGRD